MPGRVKTASRRAMDLKRMLWKMNPGYVYFSLWMHRLGSSGGQIMTSPRLMPMLLIIKWRRWYYVGYLLWLPRPSMCFLIWWLVVLVLRVSSWKASRGDATHPPNTHDIASAVYKCLQATRMAYTRVTASLIYLERLIFRLWLDEYVRVCGYVSFAQAFICRTGGRYDHSETHTLHPISQFPSIIQTKLKVLFKFEMKI